MSPICLDVTRLMKNLLTGRRATGVDRVGLAYVRHYAPEALAVLAIRGVDACMDRRTSALVFAMLLGDARESAASAWGMMARVLSGAWNRRVPAGAILLHTSHSGAESVHYFRSLHRRGVRLVVMIHDLIPLTHSEYCREGTTGIHERRIRHALGYAASIIANSQATSDSLRSYAQANGLAVPATTVAGLAAGIQGRAGASPLADTPYFVMLGTIEPRKNHWFMLHVWRRLAGEMGVFTPKLVLIGRRGWKCENTIDMLRDCAALRDVVIHESDCPDSRLRAWLQHARALVFPSLAEGYGMPLVEALSMRVPVLASDLGVFRECAGDVPDYLDALDGPAWFHLIRAFTDEQSPERIEQLTRLARFRAPVWATHFEVVDRLLEELS